MSERTTAIGFENRNKQVVVRATGQSGNDHFQQIYVLLCTPFGHEYGPTAVTYGCDAAHDLIAEVLG